MYNKTLKKESLNDITQQTFEEAIKLSYTLPQENKSISRLCTVGIYGDSQTDLRSVVNIERLNNETQLFITNAVGKILFYGTLSKDLGLETIAKQYWEIFNLVKYTI